jgi:hypothetical protein
MRENSFQEGFNNLIMALISKQFDTYFIVFMSDKIGSGGPRDSVKIACYDGSNYIGVINFDDRDPHPMDNNYYPNSGIISMTFQISRFNDIINTLRYEKPLRLEFNTDKGRGYISTGSNEPIGEQEPS